MIQYLYKGLRINLPYDPSMAGFSFYTFRDCCLVYRKKNIQVRIKRGTNMVLVEKVNEDGEVGRILNRYSQVPNSLEEFKKIVDAFY